MILYAKIMPNFCKHICEGYGISQDYYRGENAELVGTGQGNMASGATCRDQSCLVFKLLEKLKLGIEIDLLLTVKRADFFANRKECVEIMQKDFKVAC